MLEGIHYPGAGGDVVPGPITYIFLNLKNNNKLMEK
jgi:hypothetical protein